MRDLKFIVDGYTLTAKDKMEPIPRGSKGYLRCQFYFQNYRRNRAKRVCVFIRNNKEIYAPIDNNNRCNIPDEVTDHNMITFYVVTAIGSERIVTNKIIIRQV